MTLDMVKSLVFAYRCDEAVGESKLQGYVLLELQTDSCL